MEKITKITKDIGQNMTPVADLIGSNFTQLKQMVTEKVSTNTEVTALPEEYLEIEEKFKTIISTYKHFESLAYKYVTEDNNYEMKKVQNQFGDLSNNLGDKFNQITSGAQKKEAVQNPSEGRFEGNGIVSAHHKISKPCVELSEKIGLEEPAGSALFKFGSIQEKVGEYSLKMDDRIMDESIKPVKNILRTDIGAAIRAGKEVNRCRLLLDASKGALKGKMGERLETAKADVERAENHLVFAMDDAMTKMKAILESPVILSSISSFVQAQLDYFKDSAEILNDLNADIEELKTVHEGLHGSK